MLLNYVLGFFWFPWVNFYSEDVFIQVLVFCIFYFFISSINLYYSSITLFLLILLLSCILAYYNLEVLTGFLLVTEFTAFFIIIIFLLSLNFETLTKNSFLSGFFFLYFLCIFFIFFLYYAFKSELIYFLNGVHFWDDYYEAFNNTVMNDIFGLYLSYYYLNSFIFFLFIFLIFIASLVCILLVKMSKLTVYCNTLSFSLVFDFFKDLVAFDFLRKQNMNYQSKKKPTIRLVKFKKLNVAKE